MRNIAAIKAKTNAHYTCEECSSRELIQTHHEIAGDDSTIVVLCGECHSKKHPDVPKALFLSVIRQRYWFNKSAASLARELGVHPRTVTRAAKKLNILPGELRLKDEQLIRKIISIRMAVLRGKGYEYCTASQTCQKLRLSRHQIDFRIERGIFPRPTFIDSAGVRYFDEEWIKRAQAMQNRSQHHETVCKSARLRVIAVTQEQGKQSLVCELDWEGDEELLPEWLRHKIKEQTANE